MEPTKVVTDIFDSWSRQGKTLTEVLVTNGFSTRVLAKEIIQNVASPEDTKDAYRYRWLIEQYLQGKEFDLAENIVDKNDLDYYIDKKLGY